MPAGRLGGGGERLEKPSVIALLVKGEGDTDLRCVRKAGSEDVGE